MGGTGSGNWYRWQGRKATVEESLVVSMSELSKQLYAGASGTLTWGRRKKRSICYSVMLSNNMPMLMLDYRLRNSQDVRIPVRLETTPTRFGGKRWWFICPLMVSGVACNRRAGKLYLPPGSRYFGCRTCHDLTYRSSQEAHREERLFGRLGLDPEIRRRFSKRRR